MLNKCTRFPRLREPFSTVLGIVVPVLLHSLAVGVRKSTGACRTTATPRCHNKNLILWCLNKILEKNSSVAAANCGMTLVRTALRNACNEWERINCGPKVGMLRDIGGRIRSLSRDEFTRLLAEIPQHLAEMARFSVTTELRQANVTRLQWRQISLERQHLWVGADQHKNGSAHSVLWWSSYFGHINRKLSCRFTLKSIG